MKMEYTAPQAKRIGFAAEENLATSFDDLLNSTGGLVQGGQGDEAIASEGDITVEGISL